MSSLTRPCWNECIGRRLREYVAPMVTDAEVFVYTGPVGERVPIDVVSALVDPSVVSIHEGAFYGRKKLDEVELCEGLVEIGEDSFRWCVNSITKINIPISLRRIRNGAFFGSLRCSICLHDGIESIGRDAFCSCVFTNFRVPSLITTISNGMLCDCKSKFSLELSKNVTEIANFAFGNCYSLRNVAFTPDAIFGDKVFFADGREGIDTDLYLLFGSEERIIWELQLRFDGLPIHGLVYYLSFNQVVLQKLIAAINLDQCRTLQNMLHPTGNLRDCLGMTPLHILACSSVHDLELYRVIVEKYPTNLITEDRWGALPILYLFWGAAPSEIIQFFLASYQSLFPSHVFNWTMMVETMGRFNTSKESIKYMLRVKQMHFPDQLLDWDHLLGEITNSVDILNQTTQSITERIQFIVMCDMSTRVEALAFKSWRENIISMIYTANFKYKDRGNSRIIRRIQANVTHFEDEYPKLKEITTILELALWKMSKMSMNVKMAQHQKKMRTDESSMGGQCRITCGADVVIRHVLPYLITVADEEFESDSEADSNASSDDESNNST